MGKFMKSITIANLCVVASIILAIACSEFAAPPSTQPSTQPTTSTSRPASRPAAARNADPIRAKFEDCAKSIRMLGGGLVLYANDNNGNLPVNIGKMYTEEDMPVEAYFCGFTGHAAPAGFEKLSKEEQVKLLDKEIDYEYFGAYRKSNQPAEVALFIEKLENHKSEKRLKPGGMVLFGDMHVEFTPADKLTKLREKEAAELKQRTEKNKAK